MIWSVTSVDIATTRASFARVSRIDGQYLDPGKLSLVFNEDAELAKRPVAQSSALRTTGLNPAADVSQFFKTNSATGALRLLHDCLRNAVIFVALEPLLFLGKRSQPAPGCLGSASLKTSAAAGKLATDGLYGVAGVVRAVAVRRDIDDAKIDTENLRRFDQFRIVNVADAREIEAALDVHQVNFALAVRKQLPLVLAHNRLDLDASGQGPDRNNVIGFEAEDTAVVGLRRPLTEYASTLAAIGLVGRKRICDFSDAPNNDLRSKFKHYARLSIGQFVQIELARIACFKTACGQKITRLVAAFEGVSKQLGLFIRRQKFDVSNQFHSSNMERFMVCVKHCNQRKGALSSPP